jgi:non-haem Fe2+, alpha-ketoglutarate-dependent halogenase
MTTPLDAPQSDFRLTQAELARFNQDGYLAPLRLYDAEEMKDRWKTIRRQLRDRSRAIYPDGSNISNYDRHLDIDLLSEHVINPRIVDRVASVFGPDVLCWRSEFFPKHAGDEGTDWHQAGTFQNTGDRPQLVWPEDDDRAGLGGTITVWTAFTDSTLVNGCLQLMPGTHRTMNYDESKAMEFDPEGSRHVNEEGIARGFFGYDYRKLRKDSSWVPDESKAYPVVLKAGEFIMFWSTLMHASLPHTGNERDYRMGFAARYVPTKVQVYPGMSVLSEHGGKNSLDDYGTVLVAGRDRYFHNKISSRTRTGYTFEPRGFTQD